MSDQDLQDLKRVLTLFTEWLAREDILPGITEQECADLGKAFLAGYMLGRADTPAPPARLRLSPPNGGRTGPPAEAAKCRMAPRRMLCSGTSGPPKNRRWVLTCPVCGKADFSADPAIPLLVPRHFVT